MTHEEKMEEAIKRAELSPEILEELGDIKTLVASIIIVGAILIALAATGYGAIAEAIAIGLIVIGAAISGSQILDGIFVLIDFFQNTRCDTAKTPEDLDRAGKQFADGIAKVGVGTLMLILSFIGGKKVKTQTTRSRARARGANRAATYGQGWPKASLKDTVKNIAGENPIITHEGPKTIYTNPQNGKRVIYDEGGNYFRIQDPSINSKRNYLDLDGKPISPNKIETLPDGRTRQTGKSPAEYQQESHFLNTDE